MTLFIACLLIGGLNMSPWLYPLAFGIWWVHLMYHNNDPAMRAVDRINQMLGRAK